MILLNDFAIKIPSFRSWALFLQGLLCNMQEREWSGFDDRLCPVLAMIPGGWLLIMPRVEAVEGVDYSTFDDLPIDPKDENFGKYNGRIVAVDYGS